MRLGITREAGGGAARYEIYADAARIVRQIFTWVGHERLTLAGVCRRLLGNGTQWGVSFHYTVQPKPEGLAQAFILGRSFLAGEPSALVLGDNLFFGHSLPEMLAEAAARESGATIFSRQRSGTLWRRND